MPPKTSRLFEVDLVKALCIPAVVVIHSVRPFWERTSVTELRIADVTLFAVPGFIAASGYLYARAGPATASVTWKRLRRVLLPYLVATLLAQLYWLVASDRALSGRTLLEELLWATAFGPYYYVQVAAFCILAAPLVQRLDARWLELTTAGFLLVQIYAWKEIHLDLFWGHRNPLRWMAFFMAGWWLATLPAATLAPILRRRAWIVGVTLAIFVATFVWGGVGTERPWWLCLPSVWFALTVLYVAAVGRDLDPRSIRVLSESTYTIYLYHLFFVYMLRPLVKSPPGLFEPAAILVPWLGGLVGPLLLVAAGRALLGERSRTWLGA